MNDPVQWDQWTFDVFDIDADIHWGHTGGVYIFAARDWSMGWYAIYIGQTGSFRNQLARGHTHYNDAIRAGATHIHVYAYEDAPQRITMERRLIAKFDPVLNAG